MWKRLHVKYSLFVSDFKETWIFSAYFRGGGGEAQMPNLNEIFPVGVELSHVDKQTDMKLIFAILNVAKAPKKVQLSHLCLKLTLLLNYMKGER
jgi:hypothetical protein